MENYKNFKTETVGIPEFDKIRNDGRLLIEYVRGSTAYGLSTESSDIDSGGIFICSIHELLGYNSYKEEVADAKNDNKWYELNKFISLLVKANPNILEALFVDDRFIIGEIHPIMKYLREHRDMFLTKQCFTSFYKYAESQIYKARGLNKKIVNPITERKTPLDFTYTFRKQGSQNIVNFLKEYGLHIEYCGLCNINHMRNNYHVFYDWGRNLYEHPEDKEILIKSRSKLNPDRIERFPNIEDEPIIHYRGLTTEVVSHTTQLRLSSIDDKDDLPICQISYNVDGFQDHCRRYREYKEWEKNRNPVRYESNLNKNYDAKNMMHSFRLIHMAKEIALGKGMNLYRIEDHDFLMNIRNHKYEYDELIKLADKEKEEMYEIMKHSSIPDSVDETKLNEILFNLRMMQIKEEIK